MRRTRSRRDADFFKELASLLKRSKILAYEQTTALAIIRDHEYSMKTKAAELCGFLGVHRKMYERTIIKLILKFYVHN